MQEGTYEWQKWMLGRLVEPAFVRKNKEVKGAYTTGEYCVWLLNLIFGPDRWSHVIKSGPELVRISDQRAYSQIVIELSVTFANGETVIHQDIGIWPFTATKAREDGTLDETAPERWEQVIKSAVTDGLKACVEYLGTCFRPLADQELEKLIQQRLAKERLNEKGLSAEGEDPEKSNNDLFGEEPSTSRKAEPRPQPTQTSGSVPVNVTELYNMADEQLGLGSKDAAQTLGAWLQENHGTSNIGAYIKTGGPEALATLWRVLTEAI